MSIGPCSSDGNDSSRRAVDLGRHCRRRGGASAFPLRSSLACGVLALLALGLSACLSLKSQTTSQRAPGVTSLRVVVCASDYNQSTYTTCDDSQRRRDRRDEVRR